MTTTTVTPGTHLPTPLLPFIALYRGNVLYLAYGLIISFSAFFAIFHLESFLQNYVSATILQLKLSAAAAQRIHIFLSILCWIFFLPFLITAWSLPVRILWLRGKIISSELLSATMQALQYSTATLYLMFRRSGFGILALLALYVAYATILKQHKSPQMLQIFWVVCAIVVSAILVRGLILFLSSIIAVTGNIMPYQAISVAPLVFQGKYPMLVGIVMTTLACAGLIHFALHHFHWRWILYPSEHYLYGFFLWYLLTYLSFITIGSVAAFIQQEEKR